MGSLQFSDLLPRWGQLRLGWTCVTLLIASGLWHLVWLWASGASWEGPLSPRKPALFGVSAGVTLWSCLWVIGRLRPNRLNHVAAALLACSLTLEVGLITLQYWRGAASHFARATPWDTALEAAMLALISAATVVIAWLCWRSGDMPDTEPPEALAIQAGLWLLLVGCGLGFLNTVIGDWNLARGLAPELWGRAGVLKYPHGAALHALQTLPLYAWLLRFWRAPNPLGQIGACIVAHILFLACALWQTFHGRARLDLDLVGGILLVSAIVGFALPAIVAIRRTSRAVVI